MAAKSRLILISQVPRTGMCNQSFLVDGLSKLHGRSDSEVGDYYPL